MTVRTLTKTMRQSLSQTRSISKIYQLDVRAKGVPEGYRNDHRPYVDHTGNVRCAARCRDGHPCKRKGLGGGHRCPNHGGMSTGPKTEAGKQRIREALARRRHGS